MVRERIADDIYVFTSRQYAQVTAGAILTKDGAVLIDTLFFPEETKAIKAFLEDRLGYTVRYLINTHYHADHSQGTYLFPHAQVISHTLCRQLLNSVGRQGLSEAQEESPELEEVQIILPDILFESGIMNLYIGGKTIQLIHLPGHSLDLIGAFIVNNRILFASDNLMPVPTLFDGNYNDLVNSLETILALKPDTIVRGHGEVILRGEIDSVIEDDLKYLKKIYYEVERVVANGNKEPSLQAIDIESCGKSRIPLNGLVSDLHYANLHKLYLDLNKNGAH